MAAFVNDYTEHDRLNLFSVLVSSVKSVFRFAADRINLPSCKRILAQKLKLSYLCNFLIQHSEEFLLAL